jgi:hypothetical protein
MSRGGLLLATALLSVPGGGWAQQAVWDPAEIAQSAEKSARAAMALSLMVDSMAHLKGLSLAVGTKGISSAPLIGMGIGDGALGIGPGPGLPLPAQPSLATVATIASRSATARALQQQVAWDGLALSLAESGAAATTANESVQLIAGSGSAADLRSDMAANSAAALAALRDIVTLKAMMAALLQMRAVGHLSAPGTTTPANTTPATITPATTTVGGTAWP